MHANVSELLGRLPGPVTPQWPKGERFVKAMAHGTMSVELYSPDGVDPQQPHSQDELYFIQKGTGEFVLQGERCRFEPGAAFFVPAGAVHRFENFSADFSTWVVFWGPLGGESDSVKAACPPQDLSLLRSTCMGNYTAEVIWRREAQDFLDNRYSRKHLIRFDGGVEIAGSSSPHVVPLPMSESAAVDPEEAFVAALSSCHMLWFLSIAAKHRYCIDSYVDEAIGKMGKNSDGKVAMTHVTLKPAVRFSGDRMPTLKQIELIHHEAHEACYIANSVKTIVNCEPVFLAANAV